jgi:isoleucyl-tRNA synthetase
MSKSLGNTIQPQEVIKESGAETLRLWVAMSDFREELRVGRQILARVVEAYRKIRNTLRYLLANLYDFDPSQDSLPVSSLQEVDRYALARYAQLAREVLDAYDAYDFPAIFQRVNQLTTVDLSAFYADVSKDRLYTFAPASEERRSAQTAMFVIADGLSRLLAPILPFTCEELWRHLPGTREESVHMAEFPSRASLDAYADEALVRDWQRLIGIRDEVNRELEAARQAKTIGTSLGARVRLRARGETLAQLERYREQLPMLFIASQVDLESAAGEGQPIEIAVERAEGEKCARCWRIVTDISTAADTRGICGRCVDALADGGIAA